MQKVSLLQIRLGERRALLMIGDLIMAFLALSVALYFWATQDKLLGFSVAFLQKRPPTWYFVLPFFWLVFLVELYDIHRAGDRRQTVRGIVLAAGISLGVYFAIYFTSDLLKLTAAGHTLPRRGVAGFVVAASVLTFLWRMFYIRIFTAPQFLRRVLLVGGGQTGQILLQILEGMKSPPFYLAGIIDDDVHKQGTLVEGVPVIGTSGELQEIIVRLSITDLIVAISGQMQGCMFQALLDAQERGVEITRMPVVYEELLNRVPIRLLEADWILRSFVDQTRVSGFYELGKRLIDIAGGLAGSVLFTFILPFVTLAIYVDDRNPIFYRQMRSGKGGQPYSILKFRTMRRDAELGGIPQWAKEDDERATRIGRYLRRTHLDELPQFLNVLRGEMSLVGPRAERPELIEMFQRHVPFYRARLLVKPGISGWAQVNFGYASTIDETITKLEYDLYYIKHRNIWMDLVILLRTPATVFGFRGR